LHCGAVRTAAEQGRIAAVLFRSVGNLNGEAKCAILAGMIFHELHDYENMQANFKEAISIFESLGFPIPLAQCLTELGEIEEIWDRREKARACFQRALSLYRTAGHRIGETACLNLLAAFPAPE
jgi:tetratricopeptide (TPR) repeat protein